MPFTSSAEDQRHGRARRPDVLGLLADGMARTKAAIVGALAGRHDAGDVALTLVRLAVTGDVEQAGGRYTLAEAV